MEADILNQILEKVSKIDRIEEKVNKIDELILRIDGIDGRLDGMEGRLDTLALKVFDMDDRMDSFATKVELKETESRLMTAIDGIAKGFKTLSEEYYFMGSRFERIEKHIGLA